MREILTLAGYEYKKIFQRKISWIALAAVLILVLFCGTAMVMGDVYVEGERASNRYEELEKQKAEVEKLSGKPVDDELLEKAEKAYGKIIQPESEEKDAWENYRENVYPYNMIQNASRQLIGSYGSETEVVAYTDAYGNRKQAMTGEEFYAARKNYMKHQYEGKNLSDGEIETHMSEVEEMETPMTYGWGEGYQRFNQLVFMNGLFLAFAVAICIAPLFAGEYTSRVDQLIMTAKYGKNKVISAKLLTGFSFAFAASLFMNLVLILELGIIYGLGDWNLPIQMMRDGFFLSIPMNVLTMMIIVTLYQVLATCMVAAVVIFCSQKMRSPFGVMIVAALLIFVPFFLMGISADYRFWYMLIRFLPTGVMEGTWIFDDLLFHIGDGYYYIYQVVPVVWLILMVISGVLVYRGFKRRQIGGR